MIPGGDQRMECDLSAVAEFLRALSHPMRLQILCRLLDGEAAVAAFESELGLKQPNLSQQLGLLREAKLVATRREAKSIFYRLADDRVRDVLAALRDAFSAGGRPVEQPVRPAAAGQRPKVLAAAKQNTLPQPRPAGECGVFSVAGWGVADTPRSETPRLGTPRSETPRSGALQDD